jgi:putative membrane protein
MINFIINLLVSGGAVYLSSMFLPGVHIDGFIAALITAFLLGLMNAVIKPILLVLTLPINILTLGLFSFVINALMILLVDTLLPSFKVDSFLWALILSLILSLVSPLLHSVIPSNETVEN